MSNSTSPQWDPAWVFPQQTTLVNAAVACLGYGYFFILSINALQALLRNRPPTLARRSLVAAVLVFQLSSTLECAAKFTFEMTNLASGPFDDNESAVELGAKMYIAIVICDRINYVLNDTLVVWRAWVLADHRVMRSILAVSMTITLGCTIAEATRIFQKGVLEFGTIALTDNLLLFVPLVFNNLLATAVFLFKTWNYRRWIKKDLQTSQKTPIESILCLLVESGFIYCGWWLLFLVAKYVHSVPLMMYYVISAVAPFTAAVYPMLIILVVEHQKSREPELPSLTDVPSRSIRFIAPPSSSSRTEGYQVQSEAYSIVQSMVDMQSGKRSSMTSFEAGLMDLVHGSPTDEKAVGEAI